MPASGRFLLDTNIVIALLEGDTAVSSNLDSALEVFLSVVVAGELFFGVAKSGRPKENLSRVERFVAAVSTLPCDLGVARVYGSVRNRLREKGRPIPENDIWIAATAAHHQLVLVTRDRHFSGIDDLSVVAW